MWLGEGGALESRARSINVLPPMSAVPPKVEMNPHRLECQLRAKRRPAYPYTLTSDTVGNTAKPNAVL